MTATFHPASNFQRTVGVPAHVRSHPAADRREIVRHQHGPTPNYAVRRTLVAAVALAVLAAAAVAV
ncbi:MAG: hypothetical protein WCA90_19390, partial [Ilumatobacteraceae bacterium]